MFAPKNILVPTDFSKFSDEALKEAADIAVQFKSKIYLLHVYNEGISQCVADYCLPDETVALIENDAFQTAKERMEKEVKAIEDDKKVDIVFDIIKGFPYETILNEQKRQGIDLVVIASHGRTGMLHNLIGSVAEKVVRSATCPVLLIKAKS